MEHKNNTLEMQELQSVIQSIFDKYGYQPIEINGMFFPENFMMFKKGKFLSDYHRKLRPFDSCVDNKTYYPVDLKNLQDEFNIEVDKILNMVGSLDVTSEKRQSVYDSARNTLADTFLEKLSAEYEKVLRQETECGLVRILYLYFPYNVSDKAESNYFRGYNVEVSPYIKHITKPEGEQIFQKTACLLAEAFCREIPCDLIDVYFDRTVKENEISSIYDMMREVTDVLNWHAVKEYIQLKDDEDYRHRYDFDPASV